MVFPLQRYCFFLNYARKTVFFVKNDARKFAYIKNFLYLCTQIWIITMKENFTNIDNQWMGRELGLKNPYEREVFAHIYRITTRGRGGWSASIRDLAERLAYPKSTIGKAVQELIKKNLLVKDGDTYRTVPIRDNDKNAVSDTVPNSDKNVPNTDNTVHEPDKSVQNMESLPPITPISYNSKINSPSFLVPMVVQRQGPTDNNKEEELLNNNNFTINIIQKDHIQDIVDSGCDVAVISIFNKDTQQNIKLATTLEDAQRYNLNILEIRRASNPSDLSDVPF